MPIRLCPDCGARVAAAEWRAHYATHRQRKGSGRAWRKLRARIISRDKNRCTQCGQRWPLEVHHRDGNWRNNDPKNLVTLCSDCHDKV